MKIEVIDKPDSKSFPKLMIGDCGEIILAIKSSGNDISGTCISVGSSSNKIFIGECCDKWDTTYFKDFEGSITLSND